MVRVYINARVTVESVMANEADLIIRRLSSLLLKGLTITSGRVADEICPDHLLHLFLVLPGSNPQQHLQIVGIRKPVKFGINYLFQTFTGLLILCRIVTATSMATCSMYYILILISVFYKG